MNKNHKRIRPKSHIVLISSLFMDRSVFRLLFSLIAFDFFTEIICTGKLGKYFSVHFHMSYTCFFVCFVLIWLFNSLSEAAKNISRGGSLNLEAFCREVQTPPNLPAKSIYPPKNSGFPLDPP